MALGLVLHLHTADLPINNKVEYTWKDEQIKCQIIVKNTFAGLLTRLEQAGKALCDIISVHPRKLSSHQHGPVLLPIRELKGDFKIEDK